MLHGLFVGVLEFRSRRACQFRFVDLRLEALNLFPCGRLFDLELEFLLVEVDERHAGGAFEDHGFFVPVMRIDLLHAADRVEEGQQRHPVRDPDEGEDRHDDGEEALRVLRAGRVYADGVHGLDDGLEQVLQLLRDEGDVARHPDREQRDDDDDDGGGEVGVDEGERTDVGEFFRLDLDDGLGPADEEEADAKQHEGAKGDENRFGILQERATSSFAASAAAAPTDSRRRWCPSACDSRPRRRPPVRAPIRSA